MSISVNQIPNPQFYFGFAKLRAEAEPCVATIGSFDGVHRGHKKLITGLKEKAAELKVPSLVMLFEPQPHEFFAKADALPRLMRLREKVEALLELGVDKVLCVKFSRAFRSLTADEFVRQILVATLNVKHLVVGDDFRFGCDRAGDFSMLEAASRQFGFSLEDTRTQLCEGERISSTRIRKQLAAGDLQQAKQLLGRGYSMSGRVIHGQKLGRELGFPTVNVEIARRYSTPLTGVFAVNVILLDSSETLPSVANIGVRPTIEKRIKPVLEAHILDREIDLYGQRIKIEFLEKLRDEVKFDSLDALKKQIAQDVIRANNYFINLTA